MRKGIFGLLVLLAIVLGGSPFYLQSLISKKADQLIRTVESQSSGNYQLRLVEHGFDFGWLSGTGKTSLEFSWTDEVPDANGQLESVSDSVLIPLQHQISILPWSVTSTTVLNPDSSEQWLGALRALANGEEPLQIEAEASYATGFDLKTRVTLKPLAVVQQDQAIKSGELIVESLHRDQEMHTELTLDSLRAAAPGNDVTYLHNLKMGGNFRHWHEENTLPVGEFHFSVEELKGPFAVIRDLQFTEQTERMEPSEDNPNDYVLIDHFEGKVNAVGDTLTRHFVVDLRSEIQSKAVLETFLPALEALDSDNPETLLAFIEGIMTVLADARISLEKLSIVDGEEEVLTLSGSSHPYPDVATERDFSPISRLMLFSDSRLEGRFLTEKASLYYPKPFLDAMTEDGFLKDDAEWKTLLVEIAYRDEPMINGERLSVLQQAAIERAKAIQQQQPMPAQPLPEPERLPEAAQ